MKNTPVPIKRYGHDTGRVDQRSGPPKNRVISYHNIIEWVDDESFHKRTVDIGHVASRKTAPAPHQSITIISLIDAEKGSALPSHSI